MIYHLFQNSVWKVVKIAKTSNLKSAVKSQSITTVDTLASGFAKLASINKSSLKNSSTKLIFVEDIQGKLRHGGSKKGPIYIICLTK